MRKAQVGSAEQAADMTPTAVRVAQELVAAAALVQVQAPVVVAQELGIAAAQILVLVAASVLVLVAARARVLPARCIHVAAGPAVSTAGQVVVPQALGLGLVPPAELELVDDSAGLRTVEDKTVWEQAAEPVLSEGWGQVVPNRR